MAERRQIKTPHGHFTERFSKFTENNADFTLLILFHFRLDKAQGEKTEAITPRKS